MTKYGRTPFIKIYNREKRSLEDTFVEEFITEYWDYC